MKDGQTIGQWLNWDFENNPYFDIIDENLNQLYFEDSSGYWAKREFDSQGKLIYYENSNGIIEDRRTPKIIEHNGRKYQLIP
jgi:hypothetical protein